VGYKQLRLRADFLPVLVYLEDRRVDIVHVLPGIKRHALMKTDGLLDKPVGFGTLVVRAVAAEFLLGINHSIGLGLESVFDAPLLVHGLAFDDSQAMTGPDALRTQGGDELVARKTVELFFPISEPAVIERRPGDQRITGVRLNFIEAQ
jgi:hypothetical protein